MTVQVAPFNRSTLYPVSLFALSVQTNPICELEEAAATSEVGAAGAVGVTTTPGVLTALSFVYGELPALLNAATR